LDKYIEIICEIVKEIETNKNIKVDVYFLVIQDGYYIEGSNICDTMVFSSDMIIFSEITDLFLYRKDNIVMIIKIAQCCHTTSLEIGVMTIPIIFGIMKRIK